MVSADVLFRRGFKNDDLLSAYTKKEKSAKIGVPGKVRSIPL